MTLLLSSRPFRVQLIAAPLKHDADRQGVADSRGFPRSIDRGSIEAMDAQRCSGTEDGLSAFN